MMELRKKHNPSKNPEEFAKANAALAKQHTHSLGATMGYAYFDSTLTLLQKEQSTKIMDQSVYQPTAAPGYFLPHCWIEKQKSIYDILSATNWTLIILGEKDNTNEERWQRKFKDFCLTLNILHIENAVYPHKYILIRPDWHIGFVGDQPIDDYFDHYLRQCFRNKGKVYESYEKIAQWFDEARTKTLMESEYLNLIIKSVPAGGSVLDLGCGTGEPIAQFFIDKGFKITGVDGSKKMIALCKKRFPTEQWIVSDMRDINLNKQFDVVLAWHSFFHLDHDSQRKMFKIFSAHTKPGGILAFTSGEEEDEVWSDNGGQQLYHASLSTHEYENLLKAASFKVLTHKVRDPECGEATVWVAEKKDN